MELYRIAKDSLLWRRAFNGAKKLARQIIALVEDVNLLWQLLTDAPIAQDTSQRSRSCDQAKASARLALPFHVASFAAHILRMEQMTALSLGQQTEQHDPGAVEKHRLLDCLIFNASLLRDSDWKCCQTVRM